MTIRFGSDRHGVRLAVTDDGVGFNPSSPGRAPTGEEGGFGLVSVHERAELIGGAVRVVSRPGEGTTLAVTAPLPAADSAIGEESASGL
jgi:signal transduction histidine kinase